MEQNIFVRREKSFVLWRALPGAHPPELIIGQLQLGPPVAFVNEQRFALQRSPEHPDLWLIPAGDCNLVDGNVYHYWFEVTDSHPQRSGKRIRVTDPTAFTVDWRLLAERPDGPGYSEDDRYPSSVVKFSQGRLVACDAGGEANPLQGQPPIATLPPNNRLVIYELPTAWTRIGSAGERERGTGTFRDVASLVDPAEEGANFSDLEITQPGRSYLTELGVNAIELLPPADSFYARQWGYGTTNFFAPDFDLGYPDDYSWPTPNRDLGALIAACHARGVRFFVDVVMAFARTNAYLAAATNDFFILDPKGNPSDLDAHNSRGKDDKNFRDGFGSSLFRYAAFVDGYDPVSGKAMHLSPARQLMKASLLRWMNDFHIDGIRMDSVENVSNWDFIQEYKKLARDTWHQKFEGGAASGDVDERFLVVGEELTEPLEILHQQRLDGLWHESFKKYIRAALIGRNADGESSFEATVRKAIDCRSFGYGDLAQAVIYLTSHDVEGFSNERLFNFLLNNGVSDAGRRVKLAFACLLTSVGVPMILAGDEFADQHDLFDNKGNVSQDGGKQVDPVNFSRLKDEWRRQIKEYVARLIKFRTSSDALSVNDTEFVHGDFQDGKRVLAWRRGRPDSAKIVVVVANFSDFGTADPFNPAAEYRVNNWPATPPGKGWREITQERDVPPERIGREPIFPWEAKVYATV
ncbi:MAG TPA: alpha-amylase family glycosyl hydrolase [Blastocatellia bacterium]|nr:alpha-amylase family glycosyl hydrolase [Blastocatellia bacterium]